MTNKILDPVIIPNLPPVEIVEHLNRYIIGQDEAKKSVAVAIRNRYRRSRLPEEMQEEISPSNLIMMGPTGVGKTEIVRRVSKILGAPYAKVEATKFTEVGYVGRDVESMVRDLVEASIRMVRENKTAQVEEEAEERANDILLEALVPKKKLKDASNNTGNPFELFFGGTKDEPLTVENEEEVTRREDQRLIFREKLRRYELEDEIIEIEVEESSQPNDFLSQTGMDQVMDNMNDLMKKVMPGKSKKRRVTIREARKILTSQEADKLIDEDQVAGEAIFLAENHGIIFIDEIDKIAIGGRQSGPDVSREGVQRDILPIVEGSVVKTKYGNVKTDYILFIAAGAFHVSKPEDLIPELQGRFPVKVRLNSLSESDFVRILTEPDYALTRQYEALLSVDGVELVFAEDGVAEIAHIAYSMNETEEDLGARRLVTVLEALLREMLYSSDGEAQRIVVDADFVKETLGDFVRESDVSKYIL